LLPSELPLVTGEQEPLTRRFLASDWFAWDRRRSEPVFGMDTLGEHQARVAARRLSQAYRRAMSPVDMPVPRRPNFVTCNDQ
jgi:hypothetical protein